MIRSIEVANNSLLATNSSSIRAAQRASITGT
jgi:hypothetical protein